MSGSRLRAPRSDVAVLAVVSVAEFVVIVGCSFVMSAKRSSQLLFTLVEGAHTGGIIAASAAAVVLICAFLLRSRNAIATQITLSALLLLVHVWAIWLVSRRISAGYEPYDDDVLVGQAAYVGGAVLQAIAAVVGIVRLRKLPKSTTKT